MKKKAIALSLSLIMLVTLIPEMTMMSFALLGATTPPIVYFDDNIEETPAQIGEVTEIGGNPKYFYVAEPSTPNNGDKEFLGWYASTEASDPIKFENTVKFQEKIKKHIN